MRNLSRITNYYNKQEAWLDWLHIAKQAHMANQTALVRKHQPADNAGYRKIDKAIVALRAELQAANIACTRRCDIASSDELSTPAQRG